MSKKQLLAQPSDASVIGRVTASAFRDDPFNSWLFQGDSLRSYLFELYAQYVYIPAGICHLATADASTDNVVGATMWIRSEDRRNLGLWPMLKLALRVLLTRGPSLLIRLMRVDAAMQRYHPKQPHLYLYTIGVLDSARGTGKGKLLLNDVLNDCDENSVPAYLESSNPANHDYYASFGFKTLEVIYPLKNSPPLELMWREPLKG